MTVIHIASKKVLVELMNAIRASKNWKDTVCNVLNEHEVTFESENDAKQLCCILKEKHKRAWIKK